MNRWFAGLVCSISALGAMAADRDPTVPPAEAGVASTRPASPAGAIATLEGSTVLVQNGQPFLVVGTRLVGVGQKVGAAKLERITETDIWLREAGQLRKVQRFAGIQRSVAQGAAGCAARPAASAVRTQSKVVKSTPSDLPPAETPAAPCEGAQP